MLNKYQLNMLNEFNITTQMVEDSLIAITSLDLEKMVKEEADLDYAFDYPKYFANGLPATTLEGDNAVSFAEILVDENVWLTDIAFEDLESHLLQLLRSLLIDKTLNDAGYKIQVYTRDDQKQPGIVTSLGNRVRVSSNSQLLLPSDYKAIELVSPTGGVIEKPSFELENFYDILAQQALDIKPNLMERL